MKKVFLILSILFFIVEINAQETLNNTKIDGFKGVWFTLGQYSKYGDKYSGGLGTYTAKHIPLAIYAPEVNKTFFVYGGIAEGRSSNADIPEKKHASKDYGNYLLCMAACFDHKTETVSRPTVVHDKGGVYDPHDNPSIAIDPKGYVWVFVSGRGVERPGYKYRSVEPYSVDKFDLISEEEMTYPQPKYIKDKGFLHLFTKYHGVRLLYFNTSDEDGMKWTQDKQLVAIKRKTDKHAGHYQISGQGGDKVGFFYNWHPDGIGNRRTNIYYMQTTDFGRNWTTVENTPLNLPITEVSNPTLVKEFFSKGENVYIKDMAFDENGFPVALYLSGKGPEPGPENGPRQWSTIRWDGKEWVNRHITTSNNNYDTGSLWINEKRWLVIIPSEEGPQKWGCGGEVVMWESKDKGITWKKKKQITRNSKRNHNYIRKVVNGVDPFMYFWGDGDTNKMSISELYFGDSKGNVWKLPYKMETQKTKPQRLN